MATTGSEDERLLLEEWKGGIQISFGLCRRRCTKREIWRIPNGRETRFCLALSEPSFSANHSSPFSSSAPDMSWSGLPSLFYFSTLLLLVFIPFAFHLFWFWFTFNLILKVSIGSPWFSHISQIVCVFVSSTIVSFREFELLIYWSRARTLC